MNHFQWIVYQRFRFVLIEPNQNTDPNVGLNQEFQTVRSEGGLLPRDLLRRLLDRHSFLAGTRAEDYGLSGADSPRRRQPT